MKRILFLGEDADALAAVRPAHDDWTVLSAESAQDALDILAQGHIDVAVCDLSVGDLASTGFFASLAATCPALTTIGIIDEARLDAATQVAPNAALYLCGPVSPIDIDNAISRVVFMIDLMNGERIRGAIGRFTCLPSLPQIYTELMQLLRDPDAGASDVAEIIQQDIGMTAKVLQIANSSYFAVAEEITNVRMAVAYIGFKLVQNLVLSVTLFDQFDFSRRPPGFDPEEVQRHAFRTATAAHCIFKRERFRDDAFSAAMLHDVGKLVMASELSGPYCEVVQRRPTSSWSQSALERDVIGADHGEIGGFLLMEWGLPLPVVEAVTHHHRPSRVPEAKLGVLSAVHVANALVGEWETQAGLRSEGQAASLDLDLIESLGLANRLDAWREQVDAWCAESAGALVV